MAWSVVVRSLVRHDILPPPHTCLTRCGHFLCSLNSGKPSRTTWTRLGMAPHSGGAFLTPFTKQYSQHSRAVLAASGCSCRHPHHRHRIGRQSGISRICNATNPRSQIGGRMGGCSGVVKQPSIVGTSVRSRRLYGKRQTRFTGLRRQSLGLSFQRR